MSVAMKPGVPSSVVHRHVAQCVLRAMLKGGSLRALPAPGVLSVQTRPGAPASNTAMPGQVAIRKTGGDQARSRDQEAWLPIRCPTANVTATAMPPSASCRRPWCSWASASRARDRPTSTPTAWTGPRTWPGSGSPSSSGPRGQPRSDRPARRASLARAAEHRAAAGYATLSDQRRRTVAAIADGPPAHHRRLPWRCGESLHPVASGNTGWKKLNCSVPRFVFYRHAAVRTFSAVFKGGSLRSAPPRPTAPDVRSVQAGPSGHLPCQITSLGARHGPLPGCLPVGRLHDRGSCCNERAVESFRIRSPVSISGAVGIAVGPSYANCGQEARSMYS